MPEPAAHIFLREWGSVSENETGRTIQVPLGPASTAGALKACTEITLAPGVFYQPDPNDGRLLLLPVVGNLELRIKPAACALNCGQLGSIDTGSPVLIRNPYKKELIRFISLRLHDTVAQQSGYKCYPFNLHTQPGQCITVIESPEIRISIGRFAMRAESGYRSRGTGTCIFSYLLQGSVEINGRLLHAGDALSVWNTPDIELESFGKESILLLVETTAQTNGNTGIRTFRPVI
ncbi:hypothetical protein [Niabella beijingensis]|uniref:pirin family protein n=1 Tax=Niabella beijingensis TaxID=2872700 RepID=UPI001CBDCDD6|nr:hypothetical protein [Niabella beijingensis]MBZ4191424.1 hypothetical protein [Niabella beijingensis]